MVDERHGNIAASEVAQGITDELGEHDGRNMRPITTPIKNGKRVITYTFDAGRPAHDISRDDKLLPEGPESIGHMDKDQKEAALFAMQAISRRHPHIVFKEAGKGQEETAHIRLFSAPVPRGQAFTEYDDARTHYIDEDGHKKIHYSESPRDVVMSSLWRDAGGTQKLPEEVTREFLRMATAHEMGHALGLDHAPKELTIKDTIMVRLMGGLALEDIADYSKRPYTAGDMMGIGQLYPPPPVEVPKQSIAPKQQGRK